MVYLGKSFRRSEVDLRSTKQPQRTEVDISKEVSTHLKADILRPKEAAANSIQPYRQLSEVHYERADLSALRINFFH